MAGTRQARGQGTGMSDLQRYRLDIQGLRALAVVPVVLFHAHPALVPGGYVGVDIFFVISGYLITRILLRELDLGRMSIADFYVRRINRLFPALYVMLAVSIAAGLVLLPPNSLAELARTVIGTVFFVSNLVFMQLADYFAGPSDFRPLLHTWSLAVEEQYYVIFPPLLLFVHRYARRWLGAILWAGAIVSFALCIWMVRDHPEAAFYLPVTRAWELLVGSLLAAGVVPHVRNTRSLDILSIAGLTMIVATMASINADTTFPGWAGLFPCIGTALILQAGAGRDSWAGRLLSWAPFVWIGALSYSLYLWHWVILAYLRWVTLGTPDTVQLVLAVVASISVAWVSLRFVEKPVVARKWHGKRVLAGGAMTIGVAAAIAATIQVAGGLPGRFPAEALAMQRTAATDSNPRRGECHGHNDRVVPYAALCAYGRQDAVDTIVWGDSYAAELPLVLAERGGGYLQASSSSCPPALDYAPPRRSRCVTNNARRLDEIRTDPRIRHVILATNYAAYPEHDLAGIVVGLDQSVMALQQAGKAVTLLYPVPQPPMNAPDALAVISARHGDPTRFGISSAAFWAETATLSARLDTIVQRTGASMLRPADRLCAGPRCAVFRVEQGPLYFDASHPGLRGWRYALGERPVPY